MTKTLKPKLKKSSKKYHYELEFRAKTDVETISAFTTFFPHVLFHYEKFVTAATLHNAVLTKNDTGWKFTIGFDCTDKRFSEIEKFIEKTYGADFDSQRFNYNDWY